MTVTDAAELGIDPDQLLRGTNPQLGAAGRRVARFIDENRQIVLASSAAALGERIGTSDATVVRTIQALGFAGLGDLKRAILNSASRVSTPADDMRRTLRDLEKSTAPRSPPAFACSTRQIGSSCSASGLRRRWRPTYRSCLEDAGDAVGRSTRPARCSPISCWI
jgi:hypothetical protein